MSPNVRFGSLADLFTNISLMSASDGEADVFRFNFGSLNPNVRFSPKRTLLPRRNSNFQGPLSARSGHLLKSVRNVLFPTFSFSCRIDQRGRHQRCLTSFLRAAETLSRSTTVPRVYFFIVLRGRRSVMSIPTVNVEATGLRYSSLLEAAIGTHAKFSEHGLPRLTRFLNLHWRAAYPFREG